MGGRSHEQKRGDKSGPGHQTHAITSRGGYGIPRDDSCWRDYGVPQSGATAGTAGIACDFSQGCWSSPCGVSVGATGSRQTRRRAAHDNCGLSQATQTKLALWLPSRAIAAARHRRMARSQPTPRRRRFLARPPLHLRLRMALRLGRPSGFIAAAGTAAASARAGRTRRLARRGIAGGNRRAGKQWQIHCVMKARLPFASVKSTHASMWITSTSRAVFASRFERAFEQLAYARCAAISPRNTPAIIW